MPVDESGSQRDDGLIESVDSVEIQPSHLLVNQNNLHHSIDFWKPESERLGEEIADEIITKLPSIPEDNETLLVEVDGFPGLSEIGRLQSSAAMASSSMEGWLPEYVVTALKNKGINAEIAYSNDSQPRNPDTAVMVRQFIRHNDNSYGSDYESATYSYQGSIWQYHVRKVSQTKESSPEVSTKTGIREKIAKIFRRYTKMS